MAQVVVALDSRKDDASELNGRSLAYQGPESGNLASSHRRDQSFQRVLNFMGFVFQIRIGYLEAFRSGNSMGLEILDVGKALG